MIKEHDIKTLVHKYLQGNCTREELDSAINLFADPYHNLDLRPTLFESWNNDEIFPHPEIPKEEFSGILDKIHHRINLEPDYRLKGKRKRIFFAGMKIAAVLIVGLLLGFSFQYLKKTKPVYYTSIAPKGSISQVILPDSTIVFLNAGSQIKYKEELKKNKREVFLDGEAWFNVTKNKKKPFVVHTSFYDVNVLGTKFNVRAYKTDQEIVTTLESGSVLVSSPENFISFENVNLSPGEQLVYNLQNRSIEIKEVNTRLFTSWKDNKIIFINMNLKEVIVLLERKFGVDIEITDNVILDYHYDGTIKDETILEVLDLLKETLPVKYSIKGQLIVITKK